MTSKQHARGSGFTLVEVIVAVLVVAIGISGLMSMVFWMVRANGWSGNMTNALTSGQDKLEEFRELPYGQINNGSDTDGPFTRTWTISNSTSNRHKSVEMTVAWTRPNGAVSKVVMRSLAANPSVPGVDLTPFDLDFSSGGGGGGGGGSTETGTSDPSSSEGGGEVSPSDPVDSTEPL